MITADEWKNQTIGALKPLKTSTLVKWLFTKPITQNFVNQYLQKSKIVLPARRRKHVSDVAKKGVDYFLRHFYIMSLMNNLQKVEIHLNNNIADEFTKDWRNSLYTKPRDDMVDSMVQHIEGFKPDSLTFKMKMELEFGIKPVKPSPPQKI